MKAEVVKVIGEILGWASRLIRLVEEVDVMGLGEYVKDGHMYRKTPQGLELVY